ncbi:MAG TPA: hypothetical protein DEQ80_10800 [Anaerolinea thermolimosa]|uniref:Uncharacterized protein n=1 Tax=Anaerolinea thermolimosa TaxID=229919 RepID=A0A3D1JJC3_9CHLR|nr:hypothetical protein [Anaerolinea thermolimosa]
MKNFKVLWVILSGFLVACAGSAQVATALPTASLTPSVEATATWTVTPTERPTSTPSPTASPSPEPSLSPTPTADFDQAEVINLLNGVGGISVVVKIPHLSVAYNMILGGIRYDCHLEEAYPDWLLCWGLARPPLDMPITQAFLDKQTGKVVMERKVVLSSAVLPTALPEGYAQTNCPDRGKNISCETECRVDADGTPCIVATCTDACGLYRSVHSCPADMKLPAVVCSPEQWKEAKAKYGIP